MAKNKDVSTISLERQLFLARLIEKKLKVSNDDYVSFKISDLRSYPLLSDFANLSIALQRIRNGSGQNFDYKIISRQAVSSVADFEMRNPARIPYQVDISVKRIKEFSKQIIELEKSIGKEKNACTFTLNEDGELNLIGSKLGPYEIETGSDRHRIVRLLAKKKEFKKAQAIADKLGISAVSVKKAVGSIRKMVEKTFHVPGESLIQTGSAGGYKIEDVMIIE